MKHRIGFIGLGNMGLAIINGMISSDVVQPKQIIVFDILKSKLEKLSKSIGFQVAYSEEDLAERSDILFLAIKPNIVPAVLEKIKIKLKNSTVIASIAAGMTIKAIENIIGYNHKIVRIMPNTPAQVNEGMASITGNEYITKIELAEISAIFNSLGRSEVVPEYLIHTVTGISGSSPAYVFMFIEAMADAAVLSGMPRDQAYKFAAQAVLGSAKMVLESGKHPGELKDMVCSPGGTTIEAVTVCIDKSKCVSGE